jgi:hypothetical protein
MRSLEIIACSRTATKNVLFYMACLTNDTYMKKPIIIRIGSHDIEITEHTPKMYKWATQNPDTLAQQVLSFAKYQFETQDPTQKELDSQVSFYELDL